MKRFKPNIFKNIIVILIILFVLFIIKQFIESINSNQNDTLNQINIGGSFNLIDQNGNLFYSKNVNKHKVIYFGYTFCPDVCPFDILKLSNFFEQNIRAQKYLQPIFITVDPKRDNYNQINNFLENFDDSIIGLTGTEEMINNVVKNFKVYKKKSSQENDIDNYLIDHTALFYILDKNDKYITHISTKNFNEDFAAFIKKYDF